VTDPVDAPRRPASGFVAPEVAAEFPGLRLDWMTVAVRATRSPPALVAQLSRLAGRYRGGSVVAMRTKPIPHAYRAFYRQIGLDPDVERIPSERVAVERLLYGGFRSVGLIDDARLLALLETGVPVWAMDADAVDEQGLGIRALEAEQSGRLAVVDGSTVHALLFADPAHPVGSRTRRVALFTIAVDGVPAIHIEEALWVCAELLGASPMDC
jgi:DNA/RNA-binding domain of Phe-tRNA-synthetase-like protein